VYVGGIQILLVLLLLNQEEKISADVVNDAPVVSEVQEQVVVEAPSVPAPVVVVEEEPMKDLID